MQRIVFMDRDGVINHDTGYVHTISAFHFIDGIFETCLALQHKGYKLIIITNQSGIGRGYYTHNDFQILNEWMLGVLRSQNIIISNVLYCPHTPDMGCNCRKPLPGMFIQAAKIHAIDKQHSWMIGDKEDDVLAANVFGINNTILVQNRYTTHKSTSNARFILPSIKAINGVI